MSINYKLYGMNQKETIEYVKEYLTARQIRFYMYRGNIISIRYKNSPMFSAHMDTVDEDAMHTRKLMSYADYLFRDDAILGADDKAGVNLILNNCENINFVLTVNEERGAIGSSDLVRFENFKNLLKKYNISSCIVLDRKGNSDIIGTENSYCNSDFEDKVAEILSPLRYKKARGVFSDADSFNALVPCVNLSVGYYNHHAKSEYLNIAEFKAINNFIIKLHDGLQNLEFTLPEQFDWYDYLVKSKLKNDSSLKKYVSKEPFLDSVKDKDLIIDNMTEEEIDELYKLLYAF